ncbi:MAG TPA: hypothetical protein VGD25_06210, partial [Immundisolibacter sp.]
MLRIFIADLHLRADAPVQARFVDFLQGFGAHSELYVLGDLFDLWLGDDLDLPRYQPVICALHAGPVGVTVQQQAGVGLDQRRVGRIGIHVHHRRRFAGGRGVAGVLEFARDGDALFGRLGQKLRHEGRLANALPKRLIVPVRQAQCVAVRQQQTPARVLDEARVGQGPGAALRKERLADQKVVIADQDVRHAAALGISVQRTDDR